MTMDMTATRVIHPEWAEVPVKLVVKHYDSKWDEDSGWRTGVLGDFCTALAEGMVLEAGYYAVAPAVERKVFITDVKKIHRYSVTYGDRYDVDDIKTENGTELELTVVAELFSGEWISVTAGNDYTGWGCGGDYSDIRIAKNERDIVYLGLADTDREELGYPKRMEEWDAIQAGAIPVIAEGVL